MRFVDTLKNIWTIEELRKRLLLTLLLVFVYRLGCYVVLPGINPADLQALSKFANSSGLMQLLDMFSGGAFSQASIFALGIMPYITASIVIQLLGMVLPSFQKMQREGESGRQKLNQYTRYLTVLILLIQGPAYLVNLQHQLAQAGGGVAMGFWTLLYLTIILAAGSMFIMWLGERITDRGIGNGISFIILVGIIARLPGSLYYEFVSRLPGSTGSEGGMVMFIVELVLLFAVTVGASAAGAGNPQGARAVRQAHRRQQAVRRRPPVHTPEGECSRREPIIFAQAIMFIPLTLSGFSSSGEGGGFFATFSNINGFWYNLVYFFMIVAFTYFYTAITVRPTQMAEDMKRNNGFIPGVKPGKKTARVSRLDHVAHHFPRIHIPRYSGDPSGVRAVLRHQPELRTVLRRNIVADSRGVVLDTLTQIESHLMMHHYDGLMKEGKIKGRTTGSAY